MTSAPTVSVITITFKDLDGLKRTVDSLRAQRYEGRIEHIVIDGGSGDDVVEYLSSCEPGFAVLAVRTGRRQIRRDEPGDRPRVR